MAAVHHLGSAAVSSSYTDLFWASHDGLRLYCRVYEAHSAGAPTVLCLHGLTRNSRDFEDLAPHLQSRYRVIVPDVRGRGRSARDPNPQNYQPAIYIQDVIGLLDTVGVNRVTVIGTSMGGLLGMMMGAGHRDRLAGLLLNDMGPEVDPAGLERIKGYAGKLPPQKTGMRPSRKRDSRSALRGPIFQRNAGPLSRGAATAKTNKAY
jgi:pimeloyl-ACP methyl ester carboxylesterase